MWRIKTAINVLYRSEIYFDKWLLSEFQIFWYAVRKKSLLLILWFFRLDNFWEWLHRKVRCPTFNPLHDTAPSWFTPHYWTLILPDAERDNGRKRARETTSTINTVITLAPGCYHAKRFAVLCSRLRCALSS